MKIGKCVNFADSSAIDAAKTVATDASVNTITLCKTACTNQAGCTHYDFEGFTCILHKMDYLKVKGDAVAINGNCYSMPAAPLNFEGACLTSTGTAIATNKITIDATATTVAKCKYACEDRGIQCSVYQFLGTSCKLFNTATNSVKGSAKKVTEGMCYRDAHQFVGKCKKEAGSADITGNAGVATTYDGCKILCNAGCTHSEFKETTLSCTLYNLGTSKAIGSNVATDGKCFAK